MSPSRALRVCVCAGEPSGDRHAAALLHALREQRSDVQMEGVGGEHMEAAGAVLLARTESLASVGFVEPLTRLAAHAFLLSRLRRRFRERRYDLVILVDYPGFNLQVARAAASAGIPALYYIAPQAWAWAPGRAERLRRTVQALAVILPFEEAFFRSRGVPARFVGHPLMEGPWPERTAARATLGIDPQARVLALLPGSRASEVRRLWPVLRDAARRLRAWEPDLEILVAGVAGAEYPESDDVRVSLGGAAMALAAADCVLCKAGTGTLEAAVVGVPSVVVYRTDPWSYAVARRVARVRFVGLVNLLAGRSVVPELIQRDARVETIAAAAQPLLDPQGTAAQKQRAAYAEVRAQLGGPGAARRTAAWALEMVA
ncbi:MAG: lipid-A-disaccharide synthase [Gemmatimonadetes bacterium]|nr:lipid-A-disaccharide synthase [Gemmatimonadota bacterium]